MSTIQMRKIEVELPENAYNVLKEMAVAYDQTIEQLTREMVYALMQCDLTGAGGDLSTQLSAYLCKKYNYDPEAWRSSSEAPAK